MPRHGGRGWCATVCAIVWAIAVAGTTPYAIHQLGLHPALAQQPPPTAGASTERSRSLDALFRSLKSVAGEEEAEAVTAEIWRLWARSGNPEVDELLERGNRYLSINQLGAAHDLFTEALTAAPDFAEAWNKRATVLYMMNELEWSLSDIEKVLTLEPRHFGALVGRGMIYLQTGRWREALEAYRRALDVHPFLKERVTIVPELERRAGERPL